VKDSSRWLVDSVGSMAYWRVADSDGRKGRHLVREGHVPETTSFSK